MFSVLNRRVLEPILTVVCPGVVCLLIGVAVYGARTFYWKTTSFQFIMIGFLVGVILLIIFRPENVTPHLVVYVKLAVLTGIGLGIGFKARQWLLSKLDKGTLRGSVAPDRG